MEPIKYGARLKYWAWLFVAMFMLIVGKSVYAQVSPNTNNANLGFESGTTQNWTISNGTGTEKTTAWSPNGDGVRTTRGISSYSPGGGKTWTVTPYGNFMLSIQAGGGRFSVISRRTRSSSILSMMLRGTSTIIRLLRA